MLEHLKLEVIRIAKEAQRSGLCKHKSGNFSARDPRTGYFVITPSGVDREELTTDQMCVLDMELHLLEGKKPSSETLMHAEIYRTRDDVNAIAHTHSIAATAFACVAKPIPALVYELFPYKLKDGRIPVAKYGRPGTEELAKYTAEAVKDADLVLMEKHGAAAVGKDVDTAYLGAQYLEEAAELYTRVLIINGGREPERFSAAEYGAWKYPEKLRCKEDK